MRINALATSLAATQSGTQTSSNDSDFQAALDRAMSNTTANTTRSTPEECAAAKTKAAREADATARENFLAYMKKTPEQRMREAVLKEMGLTEEDLKAMSPEEREATEAKIAERIKDRMELQEQKKAEETAAKQVALRSTRTLNLTGL